MKLKNGTLMSRLKGCFKVVDPFEYSFKVFVLFVIIFFGVVMALAFHGVSTKKEVSIPVPVDVCPGHTHNTARSEDGIVQVDYIDRYGNIVYLVYKIYDLPAEVELKSKQVVPGEGCEQ